MKKPLVSVIVPVFNVEAFLRESITSIQRQSLVDLEMLCINDGSTDNSRTILEEEAKKDERSRIIDQENKGLSEARNTGIMEAKGEYLSFGDSDDMLEEHALKVLVEHMDEQCLDLPYIRYAETADEAIQLIPELVDLTGVSYDNRPLLPYYQRIQAILSNHMNNRGQQESGSV